VLCQASYVTLLHNPQPGYSFGQFQINDPDPRPNKTGGWHFRGEIGSERERNEMDLYVPGVSGRAGSNRMRRPWYDGQFY